MKLEIISVIKIKAMSGSVVYNLFPKIASFVYSLGKLGVFKTPNDSDKTSSIMTTIMLVV